MTEYDHWPPIRFRFAGDVEQAKGRIPQARTLMSQLIRRMEGQERDAGQWQGQLSDGTQFRVAKMGDVHVADIFGVAPVQMPPTVSAVGYGPRDNEMPLTEGVVMPEIPEAPHVNPREILMRPHGERFKDDGGNYLWVGVGFDPSVLYTSIPGSDNISSTPAEIHNTLYYVNNVLQPELSEYSSVTLYKNLIVPTFNIIVYEPGWNDEKAEGGVFQSNYAGHEYIEDQKNQPDYLTTDLYGYIERYTGSKQIININYNTDQDRITEYVSGASLLAGVITSKTGLESGYPLLYAGEFDLPVIASVTLDVEPTVLNRDDLREALYSYSDSYLRTVATGFYQSGRAIFAAFPNTQIETRTWQSANVIQKRQLDDYSSTPILLSEVPLTKYNNEDGTFSGDPITMGVAKGKVLDGYYEVRVSAGGALDYAIPDSFPIDVYIQTKKGQPPKKYTVTINDVHTYPEGNFAGDIRDFNWKGWMDSKETTDNRTGWYNGCWLIDIKKGTVIHETDPDNLDRPWFTQ